MGDGHDVERDSRLHLLAYDEASCVHWLHAYDEVRWPVPVALSGEKRETTTPPQITFFAHHAVRVQFALRSIGATISKITSKPDGAIEFLER